MRSHFLRAAQSAGAGPENPFTLVGSSTVGTATSGATISVDIPDGTVAGDFILVVHAARSSADLDMSLADTSYTKIADLYANDSIDTNLGVHWKISDGTEVSLALPGGTGFTSATGLVQVWRGVDATTPMDVASVTATDINAGRAVSPGITTVTPGCLVVLTASVGATGYATTVDEPEGYGDAVIASPPSGSFVTKAAVASKYSASVSTIAGGVWGTTPGDSTSFSWAACTLALRPA